MSFVVLGIDVPAFVSLPVGVNQPLHADPPSRSRLPCNDPPDFSRRPSEASVVQCGSAYFRLLAVALHCQTSSYVNESLNLFRDRRLLCHSGKPLIMFE